MLLEFLRERADSMRQNLTACNDRLEQINTRLRSLSSAYKSVLFNLDGAEGEINALLSQFNSMTEVVDNVRNEQADLWYYLRKVEDSLKTESDLCNEYREKADEYFQDGNIVESKLYRRKSIERKDHCVQLQTQISSIERDIDTEIRERGARFSYAEYKNIALKLDKAEKRKVSLEDWADVQAAKIKKLERIRDMLSEQSNRCHEQFIEAWASYHDFAKEIADIPVQYREGAKVSYDEESNQTKIIFDEKPDGSHGHVQIDNSDDSIVYYRSSNAPHGLQNFTRKHRENLPN